MIAVFDAIITWRVKCASRWPRLIRAAPSLPASYKCLDSRQTTITTPKITLIFFEPVKVGHQFDTPDLNTKIQISKKKAIKSPNAAKLQHLSTSVPRNHLLSTLQFPNPPSHPPHHVRNTTHPLITFYALPPNWPLHTRPSIPPRPTQHKHRHTPMDNDLSHACRPPAKAIRP